MKGTCNLGKGQKNTEVGIKKLETAVLYTCALNYKICGRFYCGAWHPHWAQFEPGTPIPIKGAHNGNMCNMPLQSNPFTAEVNVEKTGFHLYQQT